MRTTITVGDLVTLYSEGNSISGCRVLALQGDQALLEKPRGEDQWVPISHLALDDIYEADELNDIYNKTDLDDDFDETSEP